MSDGSRGGAVFDSFAILCSMIDGTGSERPAHIAQRLIIHWQRWTHGPKISLNQEPYYKACRHLDEYVFAGKPCSYKRRLRDGERRAAKTGMKHVRAADGVVLTTASVIF